MREFSVGDIVKTQIGKEALYGKVVAFHYNYKLHDYEIYIEPFGSESSSINNWHIQHFTVIGLENIKHCSSEDITGDKITSGYVRYNSGRYPNASYNQLLPRIIDVIYHEPATIVKWSDGSKTVVKCGENDIYDPEKGLAMCIAKKVLGNKGNYYELFKKWLPKELEEGKKCRLGEVNSISVNDFGATFSVKLDPDSWAGKMKDYLYDVLNPSTFSFEVIKPEEKPKDEESST